LRAVAFVAREPRDPVSRRFVGPRARRALGVDRAGAAPSLRSGRAPRSARGVGNRPLFRCLAPVGARAPSIASGRATRDPSMPAGDGPAASVQERFQEQDMTSTVGPNIHEIAPDTYRINIPLPDAMPGGFSFNQYLLVDEKPLLFHTGPKKLFPSIRAQIETVMPLARLRYIAFLPFEGG